MTSFHSLPSLRDILNPSEDRSRASIAPTSANPTSQISERSPLAEHEERNQPQLYHNHSVPGPPSFEHPPSASPNRYVKYRSAGNEDPLSRITLSNTRNTLFSPDYNGRHHTSAPQHLNPRSATSDHLVYAVHDRLYQPDPFYSRLHIEPRSLDNGHFPGEDRYWPFPGSPDGRKYASGDCVNPQWGITKAGKPRKRLAHETDLTERATTPESTGKNHKKGISIPLPPEEADDTNAQSKDNTSRPSPELSERAPRTLKRPKIETNSPSDTDVVGNAAQNEFRAVSPRWNIAEGKHGTTLWDFDPYEVDPESCNHYLELYFTHINRASYCMFAKEQFMRWIKTCSNKSSLERMLVYSLLAMATVFSSRDQHKRDGKQFATVAKYGLDKNLGKFTLPLVQSRLILGLYYFAIGDAGKAWDLAGGGLRGASALKLNLESGVQDIREDHLDYGYTKAGAVECRRRTFWSAYIMDRFNGFCSGHLSVIQNDDCLVRLPIQDQIYESQESAETPFFENDNVDPALSSEADRSKLGSMGYHAQASSLWGEVLANIYRSSHRREYDYAEKYEEFYARLNQQLDRWMASLPPELTNSRENTDRSIREGYIGTYIGLHTLYHASLMKLNRHCRWKLLSPASVERNIRRAHHHATEVLSIVQSLSRTDRKARLPDIEFAFSTPFTSYSILTAVDILSAGGRLEDLPKHSELLEGGLEVVAELAGFWSIARRHKTSILRRIKDISDAAQDPISDKQLFAIDSPMDTTFPREEDVIYSVPREKIYQALGIGDSQFDTEKILLVEASYEGGIAYI
ncbi:MAG: hypothetical protein Q9160_004115 [Pyrenula sp. 1 TL-2023]